MGTWFAVQKRKTGSYMQGLVETRPNYTKKKEVLKETPEAQIQTQRT